MMDNFLFYGDFEIIGNSKIKDEEFDFPISYGRSIGQDQIVFLQWGLIHIELPLKKYSKFIREKDYETNPYGYYSNGIYPHYDHIEVNKAIKNNGIFEFNEKTNYTAKRDLRNPKNKSIKEELFKVFGLDINKTYYENSILTKTILPSEINKQL
jgi:hypothetical protein